ncbi:MAG: RNA polymerase sigma factor SigZ [Armatimonadetes bacterium]|nr:RNA polymerase sigma factor SigZ [Armatimonadota bacterium]
MADATEQIWNEHRAALHGFILKRVSDATVADDLLQDVFVRVHEQIGTLKDQESLKAWIYRIARNAIVDRSRSEKKTHELPESLADPGGEDTDGAQKQISECVLPFVQRLPEPYRLAVMLSEIEGLTQQEVADKLGLSLSGAKSRVQRGRAKIKEMLLDCCKFEFDSHGTVIDYERRDPCDCD